jgi:hypothetical protein
MSNKETMEVDLETENGANGALGLGSIYVETYELRKKKKKIKMLNNTLKIIN